MVRRIGSPSLQEFMNTGQKFPGFLCWRLGGLNYNMRWGMRVSENIWDRKTPYKKTQEIQHGRGSAFLQDMSEGIFQGQTRIFHY